MSPSALRHLAIIDVLGIPLLVGIYIWRLQFTATSAWVAFPVWFVASFLAHRDTPKTLGWRADNLWPATRWAAILLAILAGSLILTGFALGASWNLPPNLASLRRLGNYLSFCLLQQVALQSLLNNRLMAVVVNRWISSLLAGAIFGVLHWPNPVLVPATFIGGSAMAWLFARERNVIPLAIGQAILGSLIWWAFPPAWHHSLRVGPAYYFPR